MRLKKKTISTYLSLFFVIAFFLIFNVNAGQFSNGTLSSIYINGTAYFDEVQGNTTEIRLYNFTQQVRFDNLNSSSRIIRFYGLSNALIFNVNGSIYASNSLIDNSDNINITLSPNSSFIILNNYSQIESIIRELDPINISNKVISNSIHGTTIHYYLNSNLIDQINNIPFYPNSIPCPNSSNAFYTCSFGNLVNASIPLLEQGSNIYYFQYSQQLVLPNLNINTNVTDILIAQANTHPAMWNIILLFIFLVIAGSGFLYGSKKDYGYESNISSWFAIASLITAVLSYILFLIPLINLVSVITWSVVAIFFAMYYLFTNR